MSFSLPLYFREESFWHTFFANCSKDIRIPNHIVVSYLFGTKKNLKNYIFLFKIKFKKKRPNHNTVTFLLNHNKFKKFSIQIYEFFRVFFCETHISQFPSWYKNCDRITCNCFDYCFVKKVVKIVAHNISCRCCKQN